MNPLFEKISFVKKYSASTSFTNDCIAAICIGCITIPQALGYALIASLPAFCGITAAVIGAAVGSVCTSSSHLVLGPNNTSALIIQALLFSLIAQKSYNSPIQTLEILSLLTLLSGLIQLLFAFFHLGKLIQFVSISVITGYMVGTALALLVNQLFPIFGIPIGLTLPTVYEKLLYFFQKLPLANPFAIIISGISLLLLIYLKILRCPIPPSIIILGTIPPFATFVDSLNQGPFRVDTIQDICPPASTLLMTTIAFPSLDWSLINTLLPISFAIALIGMFEVNSIARSIATKTGEMIHPNTETFSLGITNVILSCFSSMPCSGSASRTSLNYTSGGTSFFSALLSSLFVAVFLSFITPYLQYIPKACLAIIICTAAVKLIDPSQIRFCLKATKGDRIVFLTTLAATIFLQLSLAFYIGIALSILLYLQKASTPIFEEFIYNENTSVLCPKKDSSSNPHPNIRIINIEGELFFGSTDLFQGTLRAFADNDSIFKVIIVRFKHVHDVDATLAMGLKQLKSYLQNHNRHLLLCNVPKPVLDLLHATDLFSLLGEENIIPHDEENSKSSLQKAWKKAMSIIHMPQETFTKKIDQRTFCKTKNCSLEGAGTRGCFDLAELNGQSQ